MLCPLGERWTLPYSEALSWGPGRGWFSRPAGEPGRSATLARNLADAGLIDRYHLLVFPVLLGAGKRMWSDADKDKQTLRLVESESYANGVQKMVLDVVK
jgi:hypothetical protein